ncbi:multidrug efflux MFS transporter NorA [Caldalkalibacillus thermarum]|uniref:MFS transporter n=1 Tax=Caldalkalibacillus thermarum TaxID=296745 RepID=UPI0016650A3C|nr:MFS transporter [Caldalkalibacillus thermarum]GGK14047.1 multidrug efflux MFS transporter NorA [Caldalkalibacillus thermarum]
MRGYISELLSLPRGVKQFLLSEPLLGIAFGLYTLLFNLHLLGVNMTEVEIGKLTALGTFAMAVFAIPCGLLADRVGRKKILVSGLGLIAASYYIIACGSFFHQFLLAQLVWALGMAMMLSAEIPLLFAYCQTKKQQTQTYNMMFAVFTLFTGLGTMLGGLLPRWLDPAHEHYRGTMLVMAATMTLVTLARSFLPAEQQTRSRCGQYRFSFKQSIPSRHVLIFVGFSFFAGAAFSVLVPYFNIIVKFRLEWSDTAVAALLTLNGLVLSAASFLTPYLLERWGLRRISFILFVLTVASSVILAIFLPVWLFIAFFLLRSGAFVAWFNVVEGQSMQTTPDEERSMHASLRSITRNLGSTAAAYLGGIILAYENYWLPFLLSGAVVLGAYIYYRVLMLHSMEKELNKG